MYEVEVKVPADHEAVRARLGELGAERVGRVTQRDTYYDAPHRQFAETDEALRIRREATTPGTGRSGDGVTGETAETDEAEEIDGADDDRIRVTYKGPLVEDESKTREEFETDVGDDRAMREILERLGFEPAAVVDKERERYALAGYVVTLDRVTDLGEFVEVEREAAADEIEAVREGAYDVLRDLGLDPGRQIRTSYLGLLLERD
jgi:adenylate cyclase class 2